MGSAGIATPTPTGAIRYDCFGTLQYGRFHDPLTLQVISGTILCIMQRKLKIALPSTNKPS